jgi:hypothetical protein
VVRKRLAAQDILRQGLVLPHWASVGLADLHTVGDAVRRQPSRHAMNVSAALGVPLAQRIVQSSIVIRGDRFMLRE